MKEWQRTVILAVLLILAIALVLWSRQSNIDTLTIAATSG